MSQWVPVILDSFIKFFDSFSDHKRPRDTKEGEKSDDGLLARISIESMGLVPEICGMTKYGIVQFSQ